MGLGKPKVQRGAAVEFRLAMSVASLALTALSMQPTAMETSALSCHLIRC